MRDTRIILVEGMPGTGKSTVSQIISLRLRAAGQPALWCHEERAAHPVRLFYDPEGHRSWAGYGDEAESRWRNYAEPLRTRNQIAVLDALILQNHVRSMLLFDCDLGSVLDLVRRIETLLVSLRPVWIYLKPDDVERNFRDVVSARGESLRDLWVEAQQRFPYARRNRASGYAGFIAFWKEFDAIADRIFEELTISKIRHNVSGVDHDAGIGEILGFLGLPKPADSSPPDLERFAGKYVARDDQTTTGLSVQTDGRCLIAICDEPTMDARRGPFGCYRETRLIPNGKNRFYVAAWPHEVEFAEDRTGAVVGIRVSVVEEGWEQPSATYVKQ